MAELSNLTRLQPLSKSSPEVVDQQQQQLSNGKFAANETPDCYLRNDKNSGQSYRKTHRRNSMDSNRTRSVNYQQQLREDRESTNRTMENVSYDRNAFAGEAVDREDSLICNNNNNDIERHQQPGTPKLAKSAQDKLRKLKEEQQRLSANKNNNIHRSDQSHSRHHQQQQQQYHHHQSETLSYNQLHLDLDAPDHVDSSSAPTRPALSKKRKSKGGGSRRNSDPFGPPSSSKNPFSKSSKIRNSNSFTSINNDIEGGVVGYEASSDVSTIGEEGGVTSPPLRRPNSNHNRVRGGESKVPSPPPPVSGGGGQEGAFCDPDDRPIKPSKQNKWSGRDNGVDHNDANNHSHSASQHHQQQRQQQHNGMENGEGMLIVLRGLCRW